MGAGEHTKTQIADVSRVVRDPVTGITRQIIAGQPIPPDLVDAEEGPSVVEEGHDAEPAAGRTRPRSKAKAKDSDGDDGEGAEGAE